jgi:hypothetical protein
MPVRLRGDSRVTAEQLWTEPDARNYGYADFDMDACLEEAGTSPSRLL